MYSSLKNKKLNASPFPHLVIDDFLDTKLARQIQSDILNLNQGEFDRYSNPFETKNTLRNKDNFPELVKILFDQLTSDSFLSELKELTGVNIVNDPNKHYWGIHTYECGDKLDIHVDAGINPQTKLKKYLTLGIYLSLNWYSHLGGELELWSGDSASIQEPRIEKCVTKVIPMFNRAILFVCNDYSWHGNPSPTRNTKNSKRIFLTLSYLTDEKNLKDCDNKRQRAYFAAEKGKEDPNWLLRKLRADNDGCKQVYQTM